MVLLEAFLELDGCVSPSLAATCPAVPGRCFSAGAPCWPICQTAIDNDPRRLGRWQRYWRDNPVNAWIGGNRPRLRRPYVLTARAFRYSTQFFTR